MSVIHSIRTTRGLLAGMFALAVLGAAGVATAGAPLSGDKIKAILSDTTVEGTMSDGSTYSEFYQADGTIKGKDYKGQWTIEADAMCLVYGTDPKKTCFQVGQNAKGIDWLKDGKVDGTGTVSKGNINKY
jgi:hypothetical protein